jgi:hypothetical protein
VSAVAKVKKAIAKARAPDRDPGAERAAVLDEVRAKIQADLMIDPRARDEVFALLERMK